MHIFYMRHAASGNRFQKRICLEGSVDFASCNRRIDCADCVGDWPSGGLYVPQKRHGEEDWPNGGVHPGNVG